MVFIVQQRGGEGNRQGGCGGWIMPPYKLLTKRKTAPEEGWEEWLAKNYGYGYFYVSSRGGKKGTECIFKGCVGEAK